MSDHDSCLVSKLSHYISLRESDRQLLAEIEKDEQEVDAHQLLYCLGDSIKNLYVVKTGWLIGYTHLPNGGRHVTRFYHPGDILGLSTLAFERFAIDVRSVNPGVLCPFPKRAFDKIFREAPRLAALMFTITSREQVILMDRLRATSSLNPVGRLAYLFLNTLDRLRITNSEMTNQMNMPLTQYDLGDALGLTNVTVSRTMGMMEESRLIKRDPGKLTLLDEKKLAELCDYENRHDSLDTEWFPAG
ncbi:MAG: Crp/Fnr family transcriptional regulator [Congregibacter sp.]